MNAIRDGNHIRIYDAFLAKESIKEIDGRFYDPDDKAWVVPYSKENVALLQLLGASRYAFAGYQDAGRRRRSPAHSDADQGNTLSASDQSI